MYRIVKRLHSDTKMFARNFSYRDLLNEGCSPRWVSPLETDAGQGFELLPPAAVSGGDARAAALNGVAAFFEIRFQDAIKREANPSDPCEQHF